MGREASHADLEPVLNNALRQPCPQQITPQQRHVMGHDVFGLAPQHQVVTVPMNSRAVGKLPMHTLSSNIMLLSGALRPQLDADADRWN